MDFLQTPRTRREPAVAGLALLAIALLVPTGLARWSPAQAQPAPVSQASHAPVPHRTADHHLWDHDLSDYDLGAQPTLMDMHIGGSTRRVLLQGTKTGSVFILDAASGAPLGVVEHRPVPQGGMPGRMQATPGGSVVVYALPR